LGLAFLDRPKGSPPSSPEPPFSASHSHSASFSRNCSPPPSECWNRELCYGLSSFPLRASWAHFPPSKLCLTFPFFLISLSCLGSVLGLPLETHSHPYIRTLQLLSSSLELWCSSLGVGVDWLASVQVSEARVCMFFFYIYILLVSVWFRVCDAWMMSVLV